MPCLHGSRTRCGINRAAAVHDTSRGMQAACVGCFVHDCVLCGLSMVDGLLCSLQKVLHIIWCSAVKAAERISGTHGALSTPGFAKVSL